MFLVLPFCDHVCLMNLLFDSGVLSFVDFSSLRLFIFAFNCLMASQLLLKCLIPNFGI